MKENTQLINRQITPNKRAGQDRATSSRVDRHLASRYTNRCLHHRKPRQGHQSLCELSVLTYQDGLSESKTEGVEEGNAPALWVKCDTVQPVKKTVWRFLGKLKIALPYDLVIALLGTHPKASRLGSQEVSLLVCRGSHKDRVWERLAFICGWVDGGA